MGEWLVTLLLPIAAWTGWWVGMRKEARELRQNKSRGAYFEGLSFLLNDETEKAVDVFLSMAEIDQQTFDNQLTLGALFRKRGELDRALHLHRQLADYPDLSDPQRHAVAYELAEDYAVAGMYAQSQQALEQLLDESYRLREVLPALWRIYETTAQWLPAIEVSERWRDSGYGQRDHAVAHYHCEIGEIALVEGDQKQALAQIEQALQADRRCGRAYWMRAKVAEAQKEYVTAIHSYQSIAEQAVDFLPDILPKLRDAYHQIGRDDEYLLWLKKAETDHHSVRLTLAVAATLAESDPEQAKSLIRKRLEDTHNPMFLSEYLKDHQSRDLLTIYTLVGKAIQPRTIYQCNECGFRQQRIIWHCPSCHAWSSFRPYIELKLEQR